MMIYVWGLQAKAGSPNRRSHRLARNRSGRQRLGFRFRWIWAGEPVDVGVKWDRWETLRAFSGWMENGKSGELLINALTRGEVRSDWRRGQRLRRQKKSNWSSRCDNPVQRTDVGCISKCFLIASYERPHTDICVSQLSNTVLNTVHDGSWHVMM